MFARIVQVQLKSESIESAVTHFRDTVGPALKQLDGFKNSRFLTNADTGKCLMVTLWESEEHRQGAETNGFLQGVMTDMKGFFASPPVIDYYEVNVQVAQA